MSYITKISSIINNKLTPMSIAQSNVITRSLGSAGGGISLSASCGAFSSGSTSYVTATNLSINLSTYGNAVMLMLVSDQSGNPSFFGNTVNTSQVRILNASTSNSSAEYFNGATGLRGFCITGLDYSTIGTAGTFNYQAQILSGGGSTQLEWYRLIAFELS